MTRHAKTAPSRAVSGRFDRPGSIGILLSALIVAIAMLPSSAIAVKTHPPLSFSPITGSGTGVTLARPSGIAVDESNGNVFLNDGGGENKVDIFGAEGGVPPGVASPYQITGSSFNSEPSGVAVDNATGSPNKGALYVTDVLGSKVKKYVRSGEAYEALGELAPSAGAGLHEPLGVAVDSKGDVFVADYGSSSIVEFGPTGAQLARISTSATVNRPSALAFDSAGDLFVQSFSNGSVYKYPANGAGEIQESVHTEVVASSATGVAVNRATDSLYIGLGDHVSQYDASSLALQLEFGVGALGKTERIAVNSTDGRIYVADSGKANISVFGPEEVIIPGVVVSPVTGLTSTRATLNASINPDGVAVSECKFEYGTSIAYGSTLPCNGAIPPDSADHPVSAALTGLTTNTTYHFRVVARNSNGSNQSTDQTFATNQPVATRPATEVTSRKATLNGTVFPEGETVTDCKFEYGTSESYGSTVPCEGAIPSDEGEHSVTAHLSALTTNTNFHFRLVVTIGGGASPGTDRTFTTNQPAVTGDATEVTGRKATLNGTVLPEGETVTDCKFEYGTSGAYGSSAPCVGGIPSDNGEHSVTAALTGLVPNGTPYHYRLRILTSAGPSLGGDRQFLTASTVVTDAATAIAPPTATLNGSLNPEGVAFTACTFEYGFTAAYESSVPCAESPASIGNGLSPVGVHADLTDVTFGATYHYRLSASSSEGVAYGLDHTFDTPGAVIESAWAASVERTEATLKARINPKGGSTTFHIEFGTDQTYGSSTAESAVGGDEVAHTVVNSLTGLAPGTTYHWRVVATGSLGVSIGADHTFTTYLTQVAKTDCPNQVFRTGPSANLSDCRAYEMVSPVDKNNGDIITRINGTGYATGLNQSAEDGSAFTYSAYRAFANPKSAPFTSQFLARRDANTGWSTVSVDPPRARRFIDAFEGAYKAFTPDLSSGWMLQEAESPLDSCAPVGFADLYRRDSGSGAFEALSCVKPSSVLPENYFPELQGFSDDGSRAVFRTNEALTSDAAATHAAQVYETTGAGQLRLISVLPNGHAVQREASAGENFFEFERFNQGRYGQLHHAVSSDGSRVFWSTRGRDGGPSFGPGTIYLRLNADREQSLSGACDEPEKACTIPVSETVTTAGARFEAANPEGTKALFVISDGFGSALNGNMYEFDLADKQSQLIAENTTGNATLGASDDLSRVYFVSESASPQQQSEGALRGEPNIYVYDEGVTHFVAALSSSDEANSFGTPTGQLLLDRTAQVSSDGELVFMSDSVATAERVANFDNRDINSGQPDAEVYLYDPAANGGTGKLRCVSCNPSGTRPVGRQLERDLSTTNYRGAASLALARTALFQPRDISDDGTRVFFNSFDPLALGDTNGKGDVYEWSALGTGGCDTANAAYAQRSEGCVTLISSGQSADDSTFFDATPSGSDAFFTTAESLLPQDPGLVDVYDARIEGGFPPPPKPPAVCEGEACQGPLNPPDDPTPSSAVFKGAGNVRQPSKAKARCRKGKHRCAAKNHRKRVHKNLKGKTDKGNDDRRAGR